MPNFTSSLGTSTDAIPAINVTQIGKFRGLQMHYPDLATLNAVSVTTKGLWDNNQALTIATEPAGIFRVWDSTALHARKVIVRPGLTVTLAADSNTVLAAAGAPSGGTGSNGDISIDFAGNQIFTKSGGAWSVTTATIYNAAGASALPVVVAYSTSIPLDGNKTMNTSPQAVMVDTAFAVSGTPVAGAQCSLKLVSNGSITPTFTGMVEWGGSAGWTLAAGTINNVTIFNDGWTTYYSITPNGSAPLTLPIPTVAAKSGTGGTGTLDITLSAAVATGTIPEAAKFTVTTTNGGAQTDNVTAVALPNNTTVRLTTSRDASAGNADTTRVSYNAGAGLAAQRLVSAAGHLLFSWANLPVGVGAFAGILDNYSANVPGAWALKRLLSGWTGVGGDNRLITVTNSTTGSTQYHLPFLTNGELDVSSLPGSGTNTVVTLYDQSGNGRHFGGIGVAPGFSTTVGPGGAMPAVTFGAAEQLGVTLASGTIDSVLFGAADQATIMGVDAVDSGANRLDLYGGGASGQLDMQVLTTGNLILGRAYGAGSPEDFDTGVVTANYFLHNAMRYGGSIAGHTDGHSQVSVKRLGQAIQRSGDLATSYAASSNTNFRWHGGGGLNSVTGKGCALFVLNTSLTDSQRNALEAAMATKWGL